MHGMTIQPELDVLKYRYGSETGCCPTAILFRTKAHANGICLTGFCYSSD